MSSVRWLAGRGLDVLRMLLPSVLLPALVRARARIALRREAVRADARAHMRWVTGEDAPDEEIERLATRYVERMIWRGEARWHPRLVTRQEIDGLEHLIALRESGTGYVVNFVHHGDYEGISPSLAWAGFPSQAVATSEMFAPDMPRWMRQQRRVVESNGARVMDVALGSAGIKAVLATGSAVALATDLPGHTALRFLGHDAYIASGAARIAFDADVPVVVVTAHPHPARPRAGARLTVSEPLHPSAFDSVEELLEVMVQIHERAMWAWPEACEYPMRRLDRTQMRTLDQRAQGEPLALKPDADQPPGEQARTPQVPAPQD